jgi:hypothetical protein
MAAIDATAIHEAAHAVVGHLFGEKPISAAILSDTRGEVVPECSWCETCWNYYHGRNPNTNQHSREIQDIYRRDAAVAIAGEIAECRFTGVREPVDPSEVAADREKVRSRASAIHIFASGDCFVTGKWARAEACALCDRFIDQLRTTVSGILDERQVWDAVNALAEELKTKRRLEGEEITEFLGSGNLVFGSRPIAHLPPPP